MFFCCVRSQEDEVRPQRLKMVVVGDGDCGKTCLLYRFAYDKFFPLYIPTVFEVETKTVYYKEREVELVMFDTAGQEDYDVLRPFSYDDVDVVVLCFSVDCPDSQENVATKWLPEIRHYCGQHVPFIIVANKTDLRKAASSTTASDDGVSEGGDLPRTPVSEADDLELDLNRAEKNCLDHSARTVVSYEEGLAVATKLNAGGYFETSAKFAHGTDAAFEAVIRLGMEPSRKKSTGLFRHKRTSQMSGRR